MVEKRMLVVSTPIKYSYSTEMLSSKGKKIKNKTEDKSINTMISTNLFINNE